MTDDPEKPLTIMDLADLAASFRAAGDQAEADFGAALGLGHGVPLDAIFLVSPDIGMRLTRDGVRPPRVRISWLLPPQTIYVVDPDALDIGFRSGSRLP